jgi:hypothetical protein
LQVGPTQDVLLLRIHRGKQVVSGEAWRLFKQAYPDRDFSDFWIETSLTFSINSFDSTFFLLREDGSPAAAASSSLKVMKTEPLSPIADEHDLSYASDVVENDSHEPGHIVELLY